VVGAQRDTAGDWTERVVEIVSKFKGCPRPARRDELTIGGVPAALLTYPDCPTGSGLYHLWVAVEHGGLAYQIVWFNHPGQEAADLAQFRTMLASVAFTS